MVRRPAKSSSLVVVHDPRHIVATNGHAAPATGAAATVFRRLDRRISATMARATSGLSPIAIGLAFADWAANLAIAPGRRTELLLRAQEQMRQATRDMLPIAGNRASPPADNRFTDASWQDQPYRFYQNQFLAAERWWAEATSGVVGAAPHHQQVVAFTVRQIIDMLSPANLPWTNPQVVRETLRTGGRNLAVGLDNLVDDVKRKVAGQRPGGTEAFKVGETVAATPGKVVYRNELIELLQYAPATPSVHAEPVLIVPAWIMKYYILDLSPHNSLIRHLVAQGHTVFCISWRNVTAAQRDLSMDDYRRLGVLAALDAIEAIVPSRKVHATGYCLGGTLLAIAAAAMAETGDNRLRSITLLAAQTDFSEPGELQLFIDDSEVAYLESLMEDHGTLEASQMAGAFQLLRSNDLVWSRLIHDYMMGQRAPVNDLMAWNADATRLPSRMHSEYLRRLFLRNDLASGRYEVDGQTISLRNIKTPVFAVATERDHVAPWRSVYKVQYLCDAAVTFVLTSGGHNAGIVSEPGHPHRHFRIASRTAADRCPGADEWLSATAPQEGSWWTAWTDWLARHSTARKVPPPPMGRGAKRGQLLADAPGDYVLQS